MKSYRVKQIIAATAICLVIAASGYAQGMDKGQAEVTGQVGVVAGVGTHASFAGSGGVAVTDKVFVFGEFGYIPAGGGSGSVSTGTSGFEFASSGKLVTFMAGAQYGFTEQRSFIPYAGAALGVVHSGFKVSSTVNGVKTEIEASGNDLAVSFGGGARYYVNDRWGFKPELMIFVSGEDKNFVRFSGGIFYQFGR